MREGLKPYLEDNTQAWDMQPDGTFKRAKRGRTKAQVRAGRSCSRRSAK